MADPDPAAMAVLPDTATKPHRPRTAAVAFADIVGYSVLMSTAGEATHVRWMGLLHGTLRPLARKYGSTLVKSTGDGVMADFPSVEDAFAWAEAVHAATRATDNPALPPVTFRIAINHGEVGYTDEDVYGVPVNTAQRLQEHAPPGGIALTKTAFDLLAHAPPVRDIGMLELRNIEGPVHILVRDPPEAVRTPRRPLLSGAPSIVVLPLEDLDGDPNHLYFASGVIDDIVISLAALPELSVIARGATVGWRPTVADPRIVGRMLGVRYVQLGSIRRRGGVVRITVDLRETEEGDSIWSDRIDASDRELFDVQDEIVARIVAGILPSVRAAELRRALRRHPDSFTAYDYTLRAMFDLDGLRRDTFAGAGALLRRAMREDPGYSMPVAWAAQWHSLAVGQGWTDAPDKDAALAGQMAEQSIRLDPRNALGFAVAGHHRAYHTHDPAEALPFFDHAVRVSPSHALSWALRSGSLTYLGRGTEALESATRGFNLSPHGPNRYYFECFVGLAHFACGNDAEAARWLRLSLLDSPGFTSAHRTLIACLVGLGQVDEARQVAADMLRYEPGFTLSAYARDRAPIVDPALREKLFSRMRMAGVPE
jgi:adenylate cyclase